jgi:dTDP-4-amino-4,6-dideoxygalactose transaminase
MYHDGLADIKAVHLPPPPEDNGEHYDVYQNYEIEADRRDDLVEFLHKKGIDAVLQWGGKGVHQFSSLGIGTVALPRTDELFKKALMLPMYPELEHEKIQYIIKTIKSFYT